MTTRFSRRLSRRSILTLAMLTCMAVGGMTHSVAAHAQSTFQIWTSSYTTPSDDGSTFIKVSGAGFSNNGRVFIGLYPTDQDDSVRHWNVTATYHAGFYWGSFGVRTGLYDCSNNPDVPYNYVIQAYDRYTGSYSNQVPVKLCVL